MAKWRSVKLSDLVNIKHGYAFKGDHFASEPPGDILLSPGNFAVGGGFQQGKVKYYRGPEEAEYVLRGGELLLTMTDLSKSGDTLGYPAIIPCDGKRYLHNQRLGLVQVKNPEEVDKSFLYWRLRASDYRHEVLASATGSTVRHTSPNRIGSFSFESPALPEQKAIAGVLGALDDKIELNLRMNETLEEMARAIFKSWFVDFDPVRAKMEGRQPAHMDAATAALFPNRLGPDTGLPEGWEEKPLDKAIQINPKRSLKKGTVAPYVPMKLLPINSAGIAEVGAREFSSGTRFENGDTLLARITPCLENGKTAFVDCLPNNQIGWGSTEYIVLRPLPPLPEHFAYLLARSEPFREHAIKNMTGTSGRQRVPADALRSYLIATPPAGVAVVFGELVSELFAKMRANVEESLTLAELRDTLLPKLMSGELRVREVEKEVEVAL